MKTARMHALALVVGVSLVAVLAAGTATAQCVPDPPSGAIAQLNCGANAVRPAPQEPGSTVAGVPLNVFVRNPIVVSVSWFASRIPAGMTGRAALRPRGFMNAVVPGSRTPKQSGW